MEIGTYLNKYLKTELSGNLVDLCPVGALTSKPYAFLARNWELKKIETVDYTDALGSNIILNSRNNYTAKNFAGFKNVTNDQLLRILPKVNNFINETWISDKTRYSFDGNSFNRNIYLENFNKKNFVWTSKFFQNFLLSLTSSLKTANLVGFLGSVSSVEESFFFYKFLKNFGSSNILFTKTLYEINKDLPNFYLFNNSLKAVDDADLILLIGVNPRTEGSMLNIRIRKQFFNKEVVIGYIGPVVEFTFPTIHLGNSPKHCVQIAEGKHSFCQQLRNSKKPLIIFGSEIGFRQDSKALQNLLSFIAKKSFLNLKNFSGLNLLHQNTTQINFCDLGINLNSKSFLYLTNVNKNLLNQKSILFFANNVDSSVIFKNEKNLPFCTLNTHNNSWNSLFQYNIPTNTLLEKDGLLINTEGLVQKFYKGLTPQPLSRNSEDFFKVLLKLTNSSNIQFATNKQLFLEAPFLKLISKTRTPFYLNYLQYKNFQKKIFNISFKNNIKNFYMTDNISKNSKIMAECSLFLKNKSNFLN